MEPLQMKRKKISGYNLRKSLAWNKAFFTEEGVLDPTELSLISGAFANTSGGGLCSIEERRTPQTSNSRKNVSSSMKSVKKNLSRDFNATSSKEERMKIQSSCKAITSQNGRPLFSTSLKRPANLNVSKATAKESKLPKFQVPSAGSCLTNASSNSTIPRTSSMQNKKISDRVSILRKYGIRSSLRNSRHGQNSQKRANDDCRFPPGLPLASPLKQDAVKTKDASKKASSLLPIRNHGNNSLKVPGSVVAHSSVCSSKSQDAFVQPAAFSHLQNTFTLVKNGQETQTQQIKPSCLRMPSPSLGYFCQSKPSDEVPQLSQKNVESSVQKCQETGDLRPLCALGDQVINGIRTTMKPKLVSDKNGENHGSSVYGKEKDTESWIDAEELVGTGDCGHIFEEDPKVIGSLEIRGYCMPGSKNHQFVLQERSSTHAMDTFRRGIVAINSAEVDKGNDFVISFEGSFSDCGSRDAYICGGEKTISNNHASVMQEVKCFPEEPSDNCLSELSREFVNHGFGSVASVDPNVTRLTSSEVEKENLAFPIEDFHILSSEDNIIRNKGSDISEIRDFVLHASNDIMSAQSWKNTIHEHLIETCSAKEREKCSNNINKGNQTVKPNGSRFLEDSHTCDLIIAPENVDHCNAISAEKLISSDMHSDVCGSEEVRSSASDVDSTGETDTKTDAFDAGSSIEDKPSSCVGNHSLPEEFELLPNSVLLFDAELNEHSASLNIDSSKVSNISRRNHGVHLQDQSIMGNESEVRNSIIINCHASAKCLTNNRDDVVSKKRIEDGKKKSNLSLVPPRNAVPFSDEWLAAIEAAGEDVLTMKGGAVQNSPPDKPRPEPSPWSPVRKNNKVGPYDCTKFARIKAAGHSESQVN
ncbi:unnamed protein product [Cuscuta epithymum]|uniref:Uncharacterized protein n=1 Tax=Cuscuta epithymum TaxID=186058 RepID=A0AAV0DRQ4_9ASTE|nr:unnamed protein product [Cuscuta epithymum]